MRLTFVAVVLTALSGGAAYAQYARPVEVPSARPVAPAPTVIAPNPGIAAPTLPAPGPTITSPPAVIVPAAPPSNAGGKARPRKCWCYFVNPATRSRERSSCEVGCCKGGDQDERC
jgi:hypothetical protein